MLHTQLSTRCGFSAFMEMVVLTKRREWRKEKLCGSGVSAKVFGGAPRHYVIGQLACTVRTIACFTQST
jgi:hypothetical protein